MIRFIAKLLIQRAYDDASDRSVDPLPRWLRRWIHSDGELRRYEESLAHLDTILTSHSKSFLHVSQESLSSGRAAQAFEKSNRNSTVAWLAIAAGISAIAGASVWWRSMDRSDTRTSIAVNRPDDSNSDVNLVMNQSVQISKRLTDKISRKNAQVSLALATLNENAKRESEQLREAGRHGLRFMAHTIPASTVRMFGIGR